MRQNRFVASPKIEKYMSRNSMFIGNQIASARKKRNLSQAELAHHVAISPQAVGKWERGESMPDITMLSRLAEIFGVDLNYFSEKVVEHGVAQENIQHSKSSLPGNESTVSKRRPDWNWDMSGSNWVDADFSGLNRLKDKFSSSNIRNCTFLKSDLSGIAWRGNDLSGCDFSGAYMRDSSMQATELSKCTFVNCPLIDSVISQCEISGCNFNAADFSGAEFLNSSLRNLSLEGSIWKHTSFKQTDFSDLVFIGTMEDCSYENCAFRNVRFLDLTILNTFFKHNRRLTRVGFSNCKVDKLTYAFLKSNGAKLEGIYIV